MRGLNGSVALVTGGASGIGKGICVGPAQRETLSTSPATMCGCVMPSGIDTPEWCATIRHGEEQERI